MNRAAVIIWLMLRDPALKIVVVLGVAGLILVQAGSAMLDSVWMAIPVFLMAAAFLIPVEPYLAPLPVLRPQVVLARILAALTTVWLPLAVGLTASAGIWGREIPWVSARRPAGFGALLTAAVLLAWLANASQSRRRRWYAGLLALTAGMASLPLLPWAYGGAAAAIALIGIWVAIPWSSPKTAAGGRASTARALWVWPLLRSGLSWRLLFVVPFAAFLGLKLSWGSVPFLGIFLMTETLRQPWLLPLPVSRRVLLWGLLLPALVPFLAGTAVGYRTGRQDWTTQTPGAPLPDVAYDYYLTAPGPGTAEIQSPWGETARPHTLRFGALLAADEYAYNPYWVGPKNSRRFADWQFARETRDIYGQAFTPEAVRAAIRAGLKPLVQQPRMQFLNLAFGAGLLLSLALLGAMRQWYRLFGLPRVVRAVLHPFGLPVALTIGTSLLLPHKSSSFDLLGGIIQGWLMRLSALLPRNNLLMAAVVLAALAALYWALETIFNQVEFPGKGTQETV